MILALRLIFQFPICSFQEHIEKLRDGKEEKHGKSMGRKRGAGQSAGKGQGPKKKLSKKAKSNML